MKKLMSVLLIGLLILTGCGKEETTEQDKPNSETNQQVSNVEITDDSIFDTVKESAGDEFEFNVSTPDEGVVIHYLGDAEVVVVPSEIEGKKVVLTSYTFSNSSKVKAAKFPSTVKECERNFANNVNVEYVVYEEGLESVGEDNFLNSVNLKKVKLPSTLKSIKPYAFASCKSLKSLEIPASVTFIGDGAFFGCSEDFTLIGEAGSYVETYAKENDINFKSK